MNKNLVFVFVFLFLIAIATAQEIQVFQENAEAKIELPVYENDFAKCTTCTCDITIKYPNGTTMVDSQATSSTNNRHYYTVSEGLNSVTGDYTADLYCSNGVDNGGVIFTYAVTPTGLALTQERTDATTRTIALFIIFGILTFIGLFFVRSSPIKVTMFILTIWFFLMGINMTFIALQDEVVNPVLENFMSFFLVISLKAHYFLLFSILIIWIITFFVNIQNITKQKKDMKYMRFE